MNMKSLSQNVRHASSMTSPLEAERGPDQLEHTDLGFLHADLRCRKQGWQRQNRGQDP